MRGSRIGLVGLILLVWGAPGVSRAAVDWNAAGDEAVQRLVAYLQVDTTNPPGNETPAAELLRGWLASEGIEAALYDPIGDPARKALLARLPGRSDRTVVLMSHSDVVPAVAKEWSHPPFAAEIAGGILYGRGALDTKGLGILQLMTLTLLHRQGITPEDTLLLLIEPDEEDRGLGIKGMLDQHGDLFRNVRMVLNEGGSGTRDLIKPGQIIFVVQTAEKGEAWMKLTANGDAGHGSVPLKNNAVVHMARALDKISRYETPIRPSHSAVEMFRVLADQMAFPNSFVMRHIDNPIVQALFRERLTERPLVNALLRTSISLTGMHGGYKTNVIPSQVEATLDCRVTVGDSGDAVRRELERVVDDPNVRIELISNGKPNESPPDDSLMAAVRDVTSKYAPGSLVAPFMSSGATDSAPFRERGIHAYGLAPMIVDEHEVASMHGIDERVPVEAFKQAVRMYYEIVSKLAVK